MWSVYPTMQASAQTIDIVNVRITHKTAKVPVLEAVSFKDKEAALKEMHSTLGAYECVLVQTCNRIELYLAGEKGQEIAKAAKNYLLNRARNHINASDEVIETSLNDEALRHILRISSGLESMVVGEDQVINQLWNAYVEAEQAKTVNSVLKHLFFRATVVGRRIRNITGIGKGAVSIGSAAVELAESLFPDFNKKKILVMGAGETGTLVAKALARRCLSPIFIANRTYERAKRLAEELSGEAIKFDKLDDALTTADVIICCTSAPHYLITKEKVSEVMIQRTDHKNLTIIDISNPRNVEKTIEDIENVSLFNIDDLEFIAEKNKKEREKSARKASLIIEKELQVVDRALKTENVRLIISEVLSHAEKIRRKELMKALKMMNNLDEKGRQVIEDLTSILLKKTIVPMVENLRVAAMNDDAETIELAIKLFETNNKH